MGQTEEPPFDELRQNVPCAAILLPREHSTEGARRTALLPVSTNHPVVFGNI